MPKKTQKSFQPCGPYAAGLGNLYRVSYAYEPHQETSCFYLFAPSITEAMDIAREQFLKTANPYFLSVSVYAEEKDILCPTVL